MPRSDQVRRIPGLLLVVLLLMAPVLVPASAEAGEALGHQGLGAELLRPVIFVAQQNGDFGNHLSVFQQRLEQLHLIADLGDFFEHSTITFAIVRQYSAIELFAPDARLAPKEVENAVGSARDALVREQAHDAGSRRAALGSSNSRRFGLYNCRPPDVAAPGVKHEPVSLTPNSRKGAQP